MKADERHELKTNELAEWLANLPQWCGENLRTIAYAAAAVVIVTLSGLWYWYNKNIETVRRRIELTDMIGKVAQVKQQIIQAHSEGMDASYVLIQVADNLQAMAQKTRDDQAASLALIKRGQALRSELLNRLGAVGPAEAESQTEQARQSYEQALQKAPDNPTLAAMARLGLGLCAEESGDFDAARTIYREMTEDPALEGTAARAQAGYRLAVMDNYSLPFVFAQPPPEPAEPEQAGAQEDPARQQDQPLPAGDVNEAPVEPQDPNGEQPTQQ
jgi:tetratricopeptide (TPR) repeat protein